MSSLRYPFAGKFRITSLFGPRNTGIPGASTDHLGVDLVAQGSPSVLAVCSGKVTRIDNAGKSKRGKYIWVSQDDGFGTIYQHLKSIGVTSGQSISAGQPIGVMGNTGIGSGAHLHFGVSRDSDYARTMKNRKGNAINPLDYLGVPGNQQKVGQVLDGGKYIPFVQYPLTPNAENMYIQDQPIPLANDPRSVAQNMIASGESNRVVNLTGTTYDIMYGRRYRVIIKSKKGNLKDVSALRCTFEITKSWYNPDNKAIISIYNLNITDENTIIKSGDQVIVEAGYAGSFYGVIYKGHIFQTLRSKENGTDYILSLVCYDSPDFSLYNVANTTMVTQASMRKAVEVVTKAVAGGQITAKTTEITYPRGKVLFGSPNAILQQIKKSTDSTYYIEDGKLNLVSAGDPRPGEVFDLGPKTGLIGSPCQTPEGLSCKCLLNPQIKLNSLFHVDNAKIQNAEVTLGQLQVPLDTAGLYRAIKIEYSGDTRGDNWYATITAITQAGSLPGLAETYGTIIN